MITVERCSTIREMPSDASQLLERATYRNPFVSIVWMEAFESLLLRERESLAFLICSVAGRVRVVVPMLTARWPVFGIVKLQSVSNFYTGIYDAVGDDEFITDTALQSEIAVHLAKYVARTYPRLALLEMQPMRDKAGFIVQVLDALARQGNAIRRYSVHGNWYEDVAGQNFESYMLKRPGQVRNTLVRKQKALEKDPGFEVAIHSDPDAVRAHFPEYESVYEASWKTRELSPAFIRAAMVGLAGHGLVNLGVLTVAGVPAAAQLWVKIHSSWAVFKLAYDPRFSKYSVGTILMSRLIEGFFAKGTFETIDFLSGDDAYKRDWATERREHWGFEAISRRSVLGQLLKLKRMATGESMSFGRPGD